MSDLNCHVSEACYQAASSPTTACIQQAKQSWFYSCLLWSDADDVGTLPESTRLLELQHITSCIVLQVTK